MDANKLAVLKDLNYEIPQCCALCAHGGFAPTSRWGTCMLQTYTHEKHTGPPRQLSISILGRCDAFELDEWKAAELEGFRQLLKGGVDA